MSNSLTCSRLEDEEKSGPNSTLLNKIDKNIHYIGDGHSNTLKMLQHLLDLEIIKKSAQKDLWSKLEVAYNDNSTNDFKTAIDQLFDKRNNYLEQDKINKNKIVFIGDLLADRGENDFFTLYLMFKMHESNIEYKIVLSNHDWEFIQFKINNKIDEICLANESYYNSLINYKETKRQQPEKHEFFETLEENYLQHLLALYYDQATNTLATHAPLPISSDFKRFFIGIQQSEDAVEFFLNILPTIDPSKQAKKITQKYNYLIKSSQISTIDQLVEKTNKLFKKFLAYKITDINAFINASDDP